jgi:hypothetical protein
VSADFVATLTPNQPTAVFTLVLPNNIALINQVLYTQGIAISALGLSTTRSGYAVIGN